MFENRTPLLLTFSKKISSTGSKRFDNLFQKFDRFFIVLFSSNQVQPEFFEKIRSFNQEIIAFEMKQKDCLEQS